MRDLYCLGWRIVQYRGAWGVRSMVAQGFDFILGFCVKKQRVYKFRVTGSTSSVDCKVSTDSS